ncbi:MAG TPA: hypothetical protein VI893_09175 [Thermoplasmata archaeon]|nr:hypothetical protein [Thermoplasmata archaeon]
MAALVFTAWNAAPAVILIVLVLGLAAFLWRAMGSLTPDYVDLRGDVLTIGTRSGTFRITDADILVARWNAGSAGRLIRLLVPGAEVHDVAELHLSSGGPIHLESYHAIQSEVLRGFLAPKLVAGDRMTAEKE